MQCLDFLTTSAPLKTTLPAAAENYIGDAGAVALGAALLEPRQNPDGTWVFNTALSTLDLECDGFPGLLAPTGDLCQWKIRLHRLDWLTNYVTSLYAADNDIGDEGAVALAAALWPKQNPDKTWVFNAALSTLNLGGAAPDPPLIPMGDPLCGKAASLSLPDDLCCTLPADVGNCIGDKGAVAMGAALEPKQNPDGTWVFNTVLSTLSLWGAAPAPPIIPMVDPLCGKSASLTLPGDLCAPAYTAADNDIGDEGAVALGAALEPKQNPDGTWVFNTALITLGLSCAGPCIPYLQG